jgi:hypothetical protein
MVGLSSSKIVSFRKRISLLFYLLPITLCLSAGINIKAQNEMPEMPDNIAPPPVKVISKEEKSALADVNDVKNRTKLSLDLMEVRLKKAEDLNGQQSFSAMLTELGGFQALMDDALKFLNRNDDGRGKVMGTFKRFEMTLRGFTPRLEMIRRDMPDRYEYHVRRLLIVLRDTRSKAVEPFFSSSVLPDGGN